MSIINIKKIWTKTISFCKDGFGYILIAYLILVTTYYYFFIRKELDTYEYLDSKLGEGFGLSFSASFLEDLSVFLFLGLVVTIVSIVSSNKNPDDYDYETRFGAVLNSDSAYGNRRLRSFVNDEFKGSLGFNKSVKVFISMEDYNKEERAYKIYTELEHVITNAVKDLEFRPKKKPRVQVDSDLKVDGKYGYIKQLRTFDPSNNRVVDDYLKGPIKEILKNPFEEDIDIKIPGNSELGWSVYYSIWHKIGSLTERGWYRISVSKYTQSVELTIENNKNFDRTVKYDVNLYRYKENVAKKLYEPITLAKGEVRTHKLKNIVLYPMDRVEIYIHEPV